MTGGKDCIVRIYDFEFNFVTNIEVYPQMTNCLDSHIKAITFNEKDNRLAIGTLSGEIFEFLYK